MQRDLGRGPSVTNETAISYHGVGHTVRTATFSKLIYSFHTFCKCTRDFLFIYWSYKLNEVVLCCFRRDSKYGVTLGKSRYES